MTDEHRCWRCGRAVDPGRWWGSDYVFGPVCERADCTRVEQALSDRFKLFWFTSRLPDRDSPGRPGSFGFDGSRNVIPNTDPSTNRRIRADRKLAEGQ